MKFKLVLTIVLAIAASSIVGVVIAGSPIGNGFTYQGFLKDGGNPADGAYDFEFRLYDEATDGAQVGALVAYDDVTVTDGLFVVQLDFGADAFDGDARWLAIGVRPGAETGVYTTLAPRQALTPAPYALHAASSGALQGYPVTGTAPLEGQALVWSKGEWQGQTITGTDSTTYSAGYGLDLTANQFAVVSDTVQARVSGTCETGYAVRTVNQDGTVVCEPIPSAFSGWALTGNAGTTAGTNFVGTTDSQALELRVNSARALRLEPNAASPNLIGGYSGNWVAGGVFGAVIGGGGQSGNLNRVVDHVGVVGGGQNNQAGSDNGTVGDNTLATVAGGANNIASGTLSAITGGSTNTAGGFASTIAGGRSNVIGMNYGFVGGGLQNEAGGTPAYGCSVVVGGQNNDAAGDYAFIGGGAYQQIDGGIYNAIVAGRSNVISTTGWANSIGGGYGNVISGTMGYATIGGGRQNTAGSSYTTIGGGRANAVSGGYATAGGGQDQTVSGSWATAAGGRANTVSGSYATVPGGVYAAATHFGEMAYAGGGFAVAGDAQTSVYVLRREYAMAAGTWHDLFLDGNSTSQRLTIASGRTVTFDILISGRTSAGESAGYRIEGVIENVGGTTALVGTPVVTVLAEDDAAWNVQVLASDSLDALLPQVQGNGETIRWVARVQTAEVSW